MLFLVSFFKIVYCFIICLALISLTNESISYCLMRRPKIGICRGPPSDGVAQKNGLINAAEDALAITAAVAQVLHG